MGHSATTCKPPLAMDATQKPMVARGGRTLSDEILVLVDYPENRICSPSAALHDARNGVSHSVAPCALQLGHSCDFQGTKWVARKDS